MLLFIKSEEYSAQQLNRIRSFVELDNGGFLIDHTTWTRDTAIAIASIHSVSLDISAQWEILGELRKYYARFRTVPSLRRIYRSIPVSRNLPLFGTYLDAWRIAGLPSPNEEAAAYMPGIAA